jgi:hypothetical protein
LLTEEQEQDAMVEILELVDYNDDMQQLIEESTAAMGLPYGLLAQIKMNLNIDRDIHTEIKLAIDEYNTAICRELTDRMRDKFPRELRDMVYRYLVPDTVNICTDEEYFPGRAVKLYHKQNHPYFPSYPRTMHDHFYTEHFWRGEALAVDMAYEPAECFYRKSNFNVIPASRSNIIARGGLATLLNGDRFGLRLRPQELISIFSREIYFMNLATTSLFEQPKNYKEVPGLVKELSLLRKGSSIRLGLWLGMVDSSQWVRFDQDRTVDKLMELVFAELVHLRRAGYHLTVRLRNQCYWEVKDGAFLQ